MTRIARAGALLALALLTALSFAGPAAAGKKRHKHGKGAQHAKTLPGKWVKHNRAKGGAKADPDDDGLTNWGEFRSHTKPRRADSDRDGLDDAQEDRERDGLDNGSEEASGTDPGVKDTDRDGIRDGAEDPDRDRLTNIAEDRTGNDPRDPDSDGDGIPDGEENAGVVKSFDGRTLTIALAAGGSLTAVVDADTDVACDDERAYEGEDEGEDDEGDDELGADDPDAGDELTDEELDLIEEEEDATVQSRLAEQGDADDEDWGDEAEADCGAELAPGTRVHEAEVEDGVFVVLELVAAGR